MSNPADVLILGCGFAGRRVAERMLARGLRVIATTRQPERLAGLAATVVTLDRLREHLRPDMLVLHSIPPDGSAGLLQRLGDAPARMIYLSSTAVYGSATVVDAATPVDGSSERARARLEVERQVAEGPWSWLILRPAAIYGPGRGVQESYKRGAYLPGDNYVSRIHVDDLAAHVEAGFFSDLSGAFPVADEEPCTAREIAEFCARLLHLPFPNPAVPAPEHPVRATGNRRVDGSAVRRALGITLTYPSYRVGIPASI